MGRSGEGTGLGVGKAELLLPAGTPDKLKTAFHFGADAVYLGMKELSLRSYAGNFSLEELEWATGYAHERGKRIVVAVNVLAMEHELAAVRRAARVLGELGPDAVVISDPGVMQIFQSEAPGLALHLSTQQSVTNSAAAAFWRARGIKRIILARELSLAQISEVTANGGAETEVFVHGAQCIAFSGRCFLSLHWAGENRDPRKGSCAQACRWPYGVALEDRRRPGQWNPLEEDERGTYFFDAKDLCALPLLDRLLETGVSALKVEGRTRSELYVGVVADVYRSALTLLAESGAQGLKESLGGLMGELQKLTNRGFSDHFLGGTQDSEGTYNRLGSPLDNRNDYLGRVQEARDGMVVLQLKNALRLGDRIEFCMPGMVRRAHTVDLLLDHDTEARLDLGRSGRTVMLLCGPGIDAGALVRLTRTTPAAYAE